MKKIKIKYINGSYDVIIGKNLIENAGGYIKINKSSKCCVICDDIVFPLYGGALKTGLEKYGFKVKEFVFKSGEDQKNIKTVCSIYDFLCENGFERDDFLVALGGGVVGDVAGFAAATYLRGIGFIQVPTTLLSQIDSSVGGKTGINLSAGKNLAGAFYCPGTVLCDTNVLSTLPRNIYADGMAEAIKHACIKSPGLFKSLMEKNINETDMIYKNIKIKTAIVKSDEFDKGKRAVLNFGHTVGHAIEKYYGYKKFSHGQSVAIGMVYAVKISCMLNICKYDLVKKITEILKLYSLPIDTGDKIDNKKLAAVCGFDKKAKNGHIKFILLGDIGKYKIIDIDKDELGEYLCMI